MLLPKIQSVKLSGDTISAFTGLNKTNTCSENECKSMLNMTMDNYPYLATRKRKMIADLGLTDIKGVLSGEELTIVSTDKITSLKNDGSIEQITGSLSDSEKTLVRMGNYICIFPDKKVYDGSSIKDMGASFSTSSVTFTLTNAKGEVITYHDAAYYEKNTPTDGCYLLTEEDGQNVLKQYNLATGSWVNITTSYVMASATGIGAEFEQFDGLKMSLNLNGTVWEEVTNLFPTEEDGIYSATYPIKDVSANAITFVGLITATKALTNVTFTVTREVPDIEFVTESMNRLWACNKEGTEIYATKLGNPFNWNCFEGISTDSWACSVGSDGEFTGAVTYLGYPTFFKENSLIKIGISSNGAHQTKETVCRGVKKGCSKSLCVVNEILFYMSNNEICAYDGSLPESVSVKLGNLNKCSSAISGRHNSKYYIACTIKGEVNTYVYDVNLGIWSEDAKTAYKAFATWGDNLVGVIDNKLHFYGENDVKSDIESLVKWSCESMVFDFYTPNAKYIHKLVIKAQMNAGSRATAYISYDSGKYERLFEIRTVGVKVFPFSIKPHRCNHFQIKLEGIGDTTIQQITKVYEEGSEIY